MEGGCALVVHDVRDSILETWAARGARRCESPEEVGTLADIVFLSLPTPEVIESVVLGTGGLTSGQRVTHIVDLSTTGPQTARKVAKSLTDCGKILIDCPVSGGVAGARAGTLTMMVGCDDVALARVTPLLKLFGRLFHVGKEPGMGQMMKLINNLLSASALALSSEALALAVKSGLDAQTVIDVVNSGSGRNSATLDKFPRQILPRTFDAGFSLGLMSKDVDLCMRQAETLGLSLQASKVVQQIWSEASREIGPDEDFTKIILAIEGPAGVIVRRKLDAKTDA
jgi:3-hydroxyisobutyrate dehydrogenase-like beta-hydroxyacid dehydrogenase